MYFITTIRDRENDTDCRTIGMFDTFNEAKMMLINQYGDPFEGGFYDWGIISRLDTGLYRSPVQLEWYKWNNGEIKRHPVKPYFKNVDFYIIG